jgi:uncharacterized membrane protein
MIDALGHVAENTTNSRQRRVLLRQADMILRAAEEEVREPLDLADIRARYDRLVETSALLDANELPGPAGD